MRASKKIWPTAALTLLAGCTAGLSPSLRRDISYEHNQLQNAEREVQRSQQIIQQDVTSDPELFRNTPAPAQWTAQLQATREKLAAAQKIDAELADMARRNRAEMSARAESLLAEERKLRRSAIGQAEGITAEASKWANFRRDLASNLDRMKRDYESVRSIDLSPLTKKVEQTERDWPAKKDVLDGRLRALREIPASAETQWQATETARHNAASGNISGSELATLIQTSEVLSHDAEKIRTGSDELAALSGQLYDSWDKVLTDLDQIEQGHDQVYRERIKTVRTHIVDLNSKVTETSSSEQWVDVPEASFHAVENDLGMAIAHKDAGHFDSEEEATPQPAGFAYIAPESQGSNQYGYWDHSGGQTVWTWLPQYLLLRELLWNHSYRPVVVDEYRGYRTAQGAGRTFYGQATPAAPPKYGTHGTFTQTSYARSRYVQTGRFTGSAYASRGGGYGSGFARAKSDQHGSPAVADKSGHRFGSGVGSPSGRRFGRSGGFRGPGRSFGRRR